MQGKITIELVRTRDIPDSGSGMPDLGFTVHQLMKSLPVLDYKDISGKVRPLGEHYRINSVRVEAV